MSTWLIIIRHKMGDDPPCPIEAKSSVFALNRVRLCQVLQNLTSISDVSYIVLQGGEDVSLYDTDQNYIFRQESNFLWTFGVKEPGCWGVIEVQSGTSILFIPRLPAEYEVWMGRIATPTEYLETYRVEQAYYVDEMFDFLNSCKPSLLLMLSGTNENSGLPLKEAVFDGIEYFDVNNDILYPEIVKCRTIKTELELKILHFANITASDGHRQIMQKICPGMREFQCEAIFLQYIYYVGGCRHPAYVPTCASGKNCAILSYGHDGHLKEKVVQDGEMCIFDLGASKNGYASSITRSFPANGNFTSDQVDIYNAVLRSLRAVLTNIRPGVSWMEMQQLGLYTLLTVLQEIGLIHGDIDDMLIAGIADIFQPHDLGHLIGVDAYDVGSRSLVSQKENIEVGSESPVRMLEVGMVLTVGPGCYFVDAVLDTALSHETQRKFLVPEVVQRFRNFGGVRIQDNVVVTRTGVKNLTIAPSTVYEIEMCMNRDSRFPTTLFKL